MVNLVGGSVVWDLDVEDKKLKAGLASARKEVSDAGKDIDKTFSGVGKSIADSLEKAKGASIAFAASLAAAGAAAVTFGVSSVKAFQESQDTIAQLEAVLKSTKGASGLLKEDILDQASALQRLTKFGDEAIVSSANLLLTFTEIKGPVMQQAIQTTLDMSQALGQDLKGSAIQLGKALNDPIQGVTALRRVGVSFNDQQLEQIKTLQESGKIMDAQKLILAELNKEFGGSAVAAGKTFSGQMEIAKNIFNDFQELIGKAITDRLAPLVQAFNEWVDAMGGPEAIMEKFNNEILPTFQRYLPIITGMIIGGLVPAFVALGRAILFTVLPAIVALLPYIIIGGLIGAAVLGIIELFKRWGDITNFIGNLFSGFVNSIKQRAQELNNSLREFGQNVVNTFNNIVNFFREIPGRVSSALSNLASTVRNSFSSAMSAAESEVSSWPGRLYDWGRNIATSFVNGIRDSLGGIRDAFINGFNRARSAIEGHSPPKEGPLKNIDAWGFNIGDAWIKGIQSAVSQFSLPQFSANVQMGSGLAPADSGGQASSIGGGQAININIGRVGGQEDIDSLIHELGYRTMIAPEIAS